MSDIKIINRRCASSSDDTAWDDGYHTAIVSEIEFEDGEKHLFASCALDLSMVTANYALRNSSLEKYFNYEDDEIEHYFGEVSDPVDGPYASVFQEAATMAMKRLEEDDQYSDLLPEFKENL